MQFLHKDLAYVEIFRKIQFGEVQKVYDSDRNIFLSKKVMSFVSLRAKFPAYCIGEILSLSNLCHIDDSLIQEIYRVEYS